MKNMYVNMRLLLNVIGQPGPFPSHPYRRPMLMAKYEDDFPLRKTGTLKHMQWFGY